MAVLFACSGLPGNPEFLPKPIREGVSGITEVQAASTGTVNADTFSWDNASVYFLLTDRFRNGNPSNDHSYNRGLDKNGNVVSGVDDRGTFHGGDFAGITKTIEEGYFNDLGINALWISAPYEQIHGYIVGGDGSPSFAHYSYHGYYVLDYTNTDANFGTMEEFRTLVDTAHEHGIRVVIDIVLNHAGYNSLYDMNEYGFGVVKDGWEDYYYSMNNVNNADYHGYIDYDADAAQWKKWWGPNWVRAGLPGYTEGGSDNFTMSLTGLPDFKTESNATVEIPEFLAKKWRQEGRYDSEVAELKNYLSSHGYAMTVTNCISYWLSTWVRDYGVDGFRCDTAKHVDLASWSTLNKMCTDALKEWKNNNPSKKLDDLDFWMTGECWDHTVSYDEYYTVGNFDSMINFDTTGAGVLSIGTVAGKYEDYAAAINTKDDFNVLSYISSHDSTLARGDQVYIGSAFLLLPGGIQVYYGDETNRALVAGVDFDGYGGAGHSLRSDMNWDSIDETVLAHWQKVGTFRNNHIAVGAGKHTTVESTSGVAFTRTYEKGNIKDRVAACIGAAANTSVTIDVSGVFHDGENVVNYYDSSSAVVANGKVTFNSGANGTILIGDPDGKPLVSFIGEAKFKGTQTVTASLKDTEQAIVSVDGAKKFIVRNGDRFTIGATAYEGDTVSISYTATNEFGTVNGKATFYKAYADENISGGGGENEEDQVKGKIRVKMADGSAPYLYAWKDNKTVYTDAWPGTLLTNKDAEGYYYYQLETKEKYNVIFNGGPGKAQTDDITGLKGEVTFEVASGFGSYTQTGGTAPEEEEVNNTITIHVKPYSSSSGAPCLYVWNNDKTYNGGFPGKQLTQRDENGDYVLVIEKAASVNCIVSGGSNTTQSGNITGITGEAWITIKSADYKEYDVEMTARVESKFSLMKKEARGIKNMTPGDYTTASWNRLYSYVPEADALVAQGEENADQTRVEALYNNMVNAKQALVLAKPVITAAAAGNRTLKGTAAYGAEVTVTLNGANYMAKADEITGIWTATVSAVGSRDIVYVTAARDGLNSERLVYDMSGSHIIPQELALTAMANTFTANVGTNVIITGTATGGSGSYTYSFLMHNKNTGDWYRFSDFTSSNTLTWTASSAGAREFFVEVKDSTGKVVRSSAVNVNVTAAAVNLNITGRSNVSSVSAGGQVVITGTAAGGSGSYTYSFLMHNKNTGDWYRFSGFTSSNTLTWTASSAGAREFFVEVKDSTGKVVRSSAVNVNVTAAAVNLSITGKSNVSSVRTGGQVVITGTAAGGSGSYTYSFLMHNKNTGDWYRFSGFTSSNTLTWTASSAGAREFFVEVKDSTGKVVRSSAVNVNVTADASNLGITGNSNVSAVGVGGNVTISGIAFGGSGSYTYSFLMHNKNTGAWYRFSDFTSSNTLIWTASSTGAREFFAEVKDSTGKVVRSSAVNVNVR
ncbi:MAG: starch-binding protein [Lachnospiraceae bacterium]|nr:starch-binding protein [Lachnospiraceae bacterium]